MTAPALPAETTRPQPVSALADSIFRGLCKAAAISIIVLAALMVLVLLYHSWPVLSRMGHYELLTGKEWSPSERKFGSRAFIFGTLTSSAVAMLIAVPIGVGSAAFLAEIAPRRFRRAGAFLVELLAAVPSVVYGFWGVKFLRPLMQHLFNALGATDDNAGAGIFTAGVLLAIMIVPYITAIAFDACRSVPGSQREAALALGATRWQMIRTAVLPYARPAIIAACFLALGRALGETMAVTMVIGNQPRIEYSLWAVGDSLASVIANQLNEADEPITRSALVTLGLLLLVITSILNVTARLLLRRRPVGKPKAKPETESVSIPTETSMEIPKGEYTLPQSRWNPVANRIMTVLLALCLLIALVPLFLILGDVLRQGIGSLNMRFFTETYAKRTPGTVGGLKHALAGSAILVSLTLVMAVPIGVMTAIFLSESRSHRLAAAVRLITEVLGGVPSIVLGIFAYSLFVVPPGLSTPLGFSAWAGSFALAVMMIPVVVRSAEEALRMVPGTFREASFALGANYWQTVVKVLLPAALPAIITGIILAASRVAGETAPLMLTAANSNSMPKGLGQATPFLPWYVFKYATRPEPEYQQLAWSAALVLLVTVMFLNIVTRLVTGRRISSSRAG